MDHYRLLSAHPGDCKGAKHVLQILECATPSIDKRKEELFVAVEERGERMFFSQRKLEDYFRGGTKEPYDKVLEDILDCECELCSSQRGEPLDTMRCKNKSKEHSAWMFVPILIYLGKCHFIYPWLRAITSNHVTSKGRIRQIECKEVAEFRENKLFDSELAMERNLFRSAYDRVWCMFNPVIFEIDSYGSVVPHHNLVDWARFPYQNEDKVRLPQGQSSTVTYAEIADEYVDPSVERRMRAYPDSIKGNKVMEPKVYCIVRKAVKVSDDAKEGMQNEILTLLEAHKNHEGADNIISLLGLYTWRGSIHYVFPFVKRNLADLLSEGYPADARDGMTMSQGALALPDIWLWREMLGVAKALKLIHQEISNPFPGDDGKVFGFHFDLKPENILVRWGPDPEQRRLQITDFGRSQIRVFDEGAEQSSQLYPGDLKYMAPEAWIPGQNRDDSPGRLKVLQTYDVWSLACIMLEVLIYLGAEHAQERSGPEALREFEEARGNEMPPVTFFALGGTKSAVDDKVQRILSWLAVAEPDFRGDAHRGYIDRLKDLLTGMFAFDMTHRTTSEEVVRVLQEASTEYSRSGSETDVLHWKIRRKFQGQQDGFTEIGWYNEKNLVSFLTMDDIHVHVSVTSHEGIPINAYEDRQCRIQLLYMEEGQGHAGKFLMKWGLQDGPGKTEKIEMLPIMDATTTHIIPHYFYQRKTDEFQYCTVISVIPPERFLHAPPHRLGVTIGFRHQAEAQAFQGALLHYKIIPGHEMYVPGAMWQKKKRTFRPRQDDAPQHDRNLNFEFWERDGPNYMYYDLHLPNNGSSSLRPLSLGVYTVIAIFRKGLPLLLLPLNTNDKRFKHIRPNTIAVDYNQADNFKKFTLLSVNKECRACQQRRNGACCTCDKTPWDPRDTFSTLDEPALSLELTLINLSRINSSSDQPRRLQGIVRFHELVSARFDLEPHDINREVACFKQATGICWKG